MGKRRHSPEVRERAVRMVREREKEHDSQWATIRSIAPKIGCSAETLRGSVPRDVGAAASVTGVDPHLVVDMEPRVWPGEHGIGGLRSEETPPDEGGEDGSAKRLGEDGGIVEEER